MERKLAAILAADVVGYSGLMEVDEAGTFDRLRMRQKELFEPEVTKHHGRIFKLMGDGLLAEFGSVVDAVECAVALQRGMAERNTSVPEEERIDVRIGINLGEVIVERDDRYGEGVNIAARLQQLADPGGICVSGKVSTEVEKKLAFGFEPMGTHNVKNISEPIAVFRVKVDDMPRRRVARKRTPAVRSWVAALAVALAAVVSWFAVERNTFFSGAISPTNPSIAVLPFDDLSPDKSLGYMGDGVAEDIITTLSRFPELVVVARTSSFNYKGKAVDIRQIGKELGIGYVLEGSVRKDGNKARIAAQLIDTKNGEHVWAERFDKSGNDPWALQDEITAKIVSAMAGEKGAIRQADYRKVWGKDTTSLAEYDYYLLGHEQYMTFTKEGSARAGEIWREGLAKYPDSPLLTVKLGWYHALRALNLFSDDPAADLAESGKLARQVLAKEHLSPQVVRLAHWLMAWALVHERNFDGALAEADKAIAVAPYDTFMLSDLSYILVQAGQSEKALEFLEMVASRDPALGWFSNAGKAIALLALGKFEQAVEAARQTDFNDAPLLLAVAYVRLGRMAEARAQVAKMINTNPAISVEAWSHSYSFRDPTILERFAGDLAQAGLPVSRTSAPI